MKNLFLGLSLAAMALLAACSSGSGTNSEPLEISSNSSSGADLFAETFNDLPVCTVKRKGAIAYVKDEKAAYACEDGDWTLDDENTTERKSNGDTGNDGKSSGSEGVEGSSASVPGGSSDASTNDVVTGTLTDTRDGQTYKTVKIGNQVWMAENLNYAYTGVPFKYGSYTSDSTSWCFGDDPANCAKYGRLYTWAAAMDSVGTWSTNGKGCGYGENCSVASAGSATLVRGVCPKGWHLPGIGEFFDELITVVGGSSTAGSKLKSATGWNDNGNGTDTYSFSALPAGIRYSDGSFSSVGKNATYWSSSANDSVTAYNVALFDYNDGAGLGFSGKYSGISVRCLKD
jgi:uncharacterized protein (TIGR02145 family)